MVKLVIAGLLFYGAMYTVAWVTIYFITRKDD